jgi:hypothetical protein
MKKIITGAAVVIGVLALTSCSKDYKGLGDAPIGTRYEAPRDVIVSPDQFPNLVTGCDGHGHRYYLTTRQAPPVVIADESCIGVPAGRASN